ncbi:hypothetical protein ACFY2H_40265 [Streptomyces griseofuscus]|uniref:hypothetical protein n=1 Tax=Streptomyces griseofuscus TaxID=146922 RepID=UPI0036BCE908
MAAAVCAVVVLGATGCSSSDSNSDEPAKNGNGSRGTKASSPDQRGAQGSADDSRKQEEAANGVENLSAKEILDKAVAAIGSAPTKRFVAPGSIDLTVDNDGNCAGTVNLTSDSPQEVLRKGNEVWVKPKDSFYATKEGKALLKAVPDARGKYMHGMADESMSLTMMSVYCQLGTASMAGGSAKPTKAGTSTVNGQKTVAIKFLKGKDTVTYYVATRGKPYILKAADETTGQSTLLTDFGKPFTFPPTPPAAQTYSAAKADKALSDPSPSTP